MFIADDLQAAMYHDQAPLLIIQASHIVNGRSLMDINHKATPCPA
jgi:hypothetical protein